MPKERPADPRSRPPWDGPTAHALLDVRAPGTLPADRQAVWARLLGEAIEATSNSAEAAAKLGVPLRTFAAWLARLEADHPAVAAGLPQRRPPGRHDNPDVAAWLKARTQKPA